MTLIPLISAIIATPENATAPVSAGPVLRRGGYDPGARHRPAAALLAFGLPVALVVVVALSPMVIEPGPRTQPAPWTSIPLPKPEPVPPQPDAKPQPERPVTRVDVVQPPIPLPPKDRVATHPPEPYVPPSGTGTGSTVLQEQTPPTPPPPLILAEVDPRFAKFFQPEYPAREQRGEVEGSVTVRVLIGTDGRVKAVEQLRSDSPGFFEATRRQALNKWRFRPATRGGTPEESWKEMTVRFQLRNG